MSFLFPLLNKGFTTEYLKCEGKITVDKADKAWLQI